MLEIPASSQILWLKAVARILRRTDVVVTMLDQCRFGVKVQKTSLLISNSGCLSELGLRCVCTTAHENVAGRMKNGILKRKYYAALPRKLNTEIAKKLVGSADWEREEILDKSDETWDVVGPYVETPHPRAARGPPASRGWARRTRWSRVAQVKWSRKEHINVGEARSTLLAVRHSSRSPQVRGRRVLIFSDSLVTVGCMSKGRSSSYPLNQQCRRAAAHILFWGTRLYMRYIPSALSQADAPSGNRRIGVVPSAKFKKERRR